MRKFETREELVESIGKKILELTSKFAEYVPMATEAINFSPRISAEDVKKYETEIFNEMVARSEDYEDAKYNTFESVEETIERLYYEDYE